MSIRPPLTKDLPPDTVKLDGPDSIRQFGGVPGLVTALEGVLSREGPAVVVATSGSTGRPKKTVLSTRALRASAEATAGRTGGHGQWLLCLPPHYVAGVQVLVRSVLAGTTPVVMEEGPFTAQAFARTAAAMDHPIRYVSLVPTQLQRLVDAADSPGVLAALRSFHAILLGGSAAPPALLDAARALGARVVTTYGMSETAGGCVYDGVPLPGVQVHLERTPNSGNPPSDPRTAQDPEQTSVPEGHLTPGRIWLGGPMVTDGYLDDPQQTHSHVFSSLPDATDTANTLSATAAIRANTNTSPKSTAPSPTPMCWYRTDDLGVLKTTEATTTPRLRVIGRADDVIVTGGLKVSAAVVRSRMLEHPGVRDAVVVPVADDQWGQKIVATVVPATSVPAAESSTLPDELRSMVKDALGSAAVPKQMLLVSHIPLLPTGKPDRSAVAELFVEE